MAIENESELLDSEVKILENDYPSGTRDFILCKRLSRNEFQLLNPIELLGTNMAVRILNHASRSSLDLARQFTLSRLLTQCLEYRGNRRHLVCEPWDEQDLRGETMFENNRTELARRCGEEQARRFEVVMTGEQESDLPADELYWGTFTTLPNVEDQFTAPELHRFANQLQTLILGNEEGEVTIEVPQMRKNVKKAWSEYFASFDLETPKRERRDLFKRLMSVSVRQASSFMRQTAYAFVYKSLKTTFSEQEEKLFELRYGDCEALGKINIGFLYEYDELHADLINDLANSFISKDYEGRANQAESNLKKHIQLLHEFRDYRRQVRSAQRSDSRSQYGNPIPLDADNVQPDVHSPAPYDNMLAAETMDHIRAVISRLKPADQRRAQALLDANGDRAIAAESLGLDVTKFNRQYRQTTKPNIQHEQRAMEQMEED